MAFTASDGFWPRLCQNTHGRNGVSKSFAETRTSVASFGILGVKRKTRCLYASSGNGVEGFYTGSAETRRFAAVHKFAMSNEESNGETRPTAVIEAEFFQRLLSVNWSLRIDT